MLKRNAILATLVAALAVTACSKKTEEAAATGQPEAETNAKGQDIKNNTASAVDATADAGQAAASAVTTGAVVAQGAAINATEAVANGAAKATENVASAVATGANKVADGAQAVANDAANSHTDIQSTSNIPEKQKY